MPEVKQHPLHTISFIDLVTTNPKASTKFYTQLLALKSKDQNYNKVWSHALLHRQGKRIGIIRKLPDSLKSREIPSMWVPYISVADVNKTVARVKDLKGNVLQEPTTIRGFAQLAIVSDPEGAVLTVWKPESKMGFDLINEPGAYCWSELYFNDRDREIGFYTDLFGWKTKTMKMPNNVDYITFLKDDIEVAGAMKIQEDWGKVPPNWMVYLTVENIKVAAERVDVLKGHIEMGPIEAGDMGWFALVKDPHETYFNIMEFKSKEKAAAPEEPKRPTVKH